ncbi:transposase [Pseudomonas brenneri]
MSKYSDQFKLTAIQAYLEDGKGFRTVAQRFAVDFSLLRRWVCAFQKHGVGAGGCEPLTMLGHCDTHGVASCSLMR